VAEHDAEDMRAAPLTIGSNDRCADAEIDLSFRAGLALQSAEWQRQALPQPTHETANAEVATGEVVLADQVLEDALGAQALVKLGQDDATPGFASAATAGVLLSTRGPTLPNPLGADGRYGWF
jgi:hypothetical protein